MARVGSEGLQTTTINDVRRLLECMNALRVAIALDRPVVLAGRLLAILDASVVAIDGGAGGETERLATAASAPGLPEGSAVPEPVGGSIDASAPAQRHSAPHGPRLPRLDVRLLPPSKSVDASADARPASIQSTYRAGGGFSVITAWRSEPFGEAQQVLLQLMHPQIVWALESAARTVPVNLESVLRLMLEGKKERDIADELGKSEHTVHAHVKRVYRHFGVNSRKQLLVRMFGTEKAE